MLTSTKLSDSRPLTDRSFQLASIKQIIDFLELTSFDRLITQKQLLTPSAKDYILIVNHLAKLTSSDIEFSGRLEEDIPNFFKNIGYPFPINKNSLLAIGAPNTWPSLLASLSWLVSQLQLHFAMETESEGGEGDFMSEADIAKQLLRIYESYVEGHDYRQEVMDFKARYQSELEEILLTTSKLNRALQMAIAERDELLMYIKSPQLIDKEIAELELEEERTRKFESQLAVIEGLKQELDFLTNELTVTTEHKDGLSQELRSMDDKVKRQDLTAEQFRQVKSQIESHKKALEVQKEKHLGVRQTTSELAKDLGSLEGQAKALEEEILLLETRLNLTKENPEIPYDLRPRLNLSALLQRNVCESQLVAVGNLNHLEELIGMLEKKNSDKPDQMLNELSALKNQLSYLNDSVRDLDDKVARLTEQNHQTKSEDADMLRLNIETTTKKLEDFKQSLRKEQVDATDLKESFAQVTERIYIAKESYEGSMEKFRQETVIIEEQTRRQISKAESHIGRMSACVKDIQEAYTVYISSLSETLQDL
jgi:kinetochore protein NDC80